MKKRAPMTAQRRMEFWRFAACWMTAWLAASWMIDALVEGRPWWSWAANLAALAWLVWLFVRVGLADRKDRLRSDRIAAAIKAELAKGHPLVIHHFDGVGSPVQQVSDVG